MCTQAAFSAMPGRPSPVLILAAGVLLAGCSGDPPGPGAATGVLVTTTTTGLDLDPDGYRLVMDEVDRSGAQPNDTVAVTALDPGLHTVALAGLSPNCSVDGPASHSIPLEEGQVVEIEFAVVCTATSGVIAVLVSASGHNVHGFYDVSVEGYGIQSMPANQRTYLAGAGPGSRTVSLIPPANCSLGGNHHNPTTVTISVGQLVRDTADVTFGVLCERLRATVRIITQTTGIVPHPAGMDPYHVDLAFTPGWYDYYGQRVDLGHVDPNGTLEAEVVPGNGYWLVLTHVPGGCAVQSPNPTPVFDLTHREEREFEFEVQCPS